MLRKKVIALLLMISVAVLSCGCSNDLKTRLIQNKKETTSAKEKHNYVPDEMKRIDKEIRQKYNLLDPNELEIELAKNDFASGLKRGSFDEDGKKRREAEIKKNEAELKKSQYYFAYANEVPDKFQKLIDSINSLKTREATKENIDKTYENLDSEKDWYTTLDDARKMYSKDLIPINDIKISDCVLITTTKETSEGVSQAESYIVARVTNNSENDISDFSLNIDYDKDTGNDYDHSFSMSQENTGKDEVIKAGCSGSVIIIADPSLQSVCTDFFVNTVEFRVGESNSSEIYVPIAKTYRAL